MFIVLLNYIKPLDKVDEYLTAHRAWLDEHYAQNHFLASGPRVPRTGGVLVSPVFDKKQLEIILETDPFKVNQIADYEIIEFQAVKKHSCLRGTYD